MTSLSDTSEERTNGTRLARLIIDGGTHVLRKFLHSLYPPAALSTELKNNETKLQNLKSKGKIFDDQWEKLFPPAGALPDAETFDLTLLHLLLREICYLVEPLTGWHNMPADTDSSREAHIVRIKCFRNDLCHSISTAIPNDEFQIKWTFISRSLVALGLDKKEIDQLKTEPIDHDTKRLEEEIMRWNDLEPRVHSVEQQLQKLKGQLQGMNVLESRRNLSVSSCLPDEVPEAFGRSQEIGQATKAIHEGEAGLVVITGAPGFGKTTVANKVAHELAKRRRIVFYCSLRSKVSLKDVATSMVLSCSTSHTQPPENPQHWLLNWSKQQLDNITFVLDNADDTLESQDSRIELIRMICDMRTLSRQTITFLITSRKTINVGSCHLQIKVFRLSSLSHDDSKKLLLSKIGSCETRNKLSQTEKIVQLCGGVPLALCIVGSLLSDYAEDRLIRNLTKEPFDVLQDDGISLENTIKTSFELLTNREQKALVILSVFPGSFDVDAAEAVIDVGADSADSGSPMVILRALKNKSLLEQPSPNKYQVHQLIQAFAKKIGRTVYPQVLVDVEKVACAHYISRLADNAELYWSKDKCSEAIEAFNEDRNNFEHFSHVYVKAMAAQVDVDSLLESSSNRFLDQFPQKCMYLEMCLLPSFYIVILETYLVHFKRTQRQPVHTVELLCLLAHEKRKIGNLRQYKDLMEQAKHVYRKSYVEFRANGLSQVLFFNSYSRLLFEKGLPRSIYHTVDEIALILCDKKLKGHPEKAVTLLFKGKREKDIHMLQEATRLLTISLGEHFMTAQGHKAIADGYFSRKDRLELCLYHYNLALTMMEKCGMDGHKETALTVKNYAVIQRWKGNYQEAMTFLKKAKRVAEIELDNDHKWKVMINTQLALLYDDLKQKEEAVAIMKNALEMFSRLKLSIDQLGGSKRDIRQFLDRHREAFLENKL